MENYSYLFLAFICGLFYKEINLWNKLFWPIIVIGLLGLFELAYGDNVFFRIISKAFPIYDGYLDLDSVLSMSRSYRTRIFITTQHPSALGAMTCCFILALTTQVKNLEWSKIKKIVAFGSLGLILLLSGSRSGLLCCLLCLALMLFGRLPAALKIVIAGFACFLLIFSVSKVVDRFSEEGQGSTISMRQEQLLYSYVYFMKSPVLGNGVRYTSKNVMERDTYNDRVTDTSIGGLESVLFYQLIDYGILGLFSYFLLFVCALIYFFRRRNIEFAKTGFFVMFSFLIFAILSGEIGGNNVLAYLLAGFCMGAVHKQESETEEIDAEEQEQITDDRNEK
ncbi:MAG: O-antigen ligase family protein [Fibrobacteraceae bacterium]|nr:O-antigen ligase family protein [Fibrobacteraceae bacterium]